jgi:hypothetical protein
MQPAPFTPDALYCVYCHAPAAGACAVCGALCCADCVELVRGIITPRAVCRSCVHDGRLPAERPAFLRGLLWTAALAALLAGIVSLLFARR